jgi:hypothetical protein
MTDAKEPDKPKPWWERLLNASAITAAVTVLGAGVLGNWIAATVQNRSKERELALLAYREYLNAELAVVKNACQLLGGYLSASENLIFMTGPAFHSRNYTGDQLKQLEAQKQEMRKEHNTLDAQWRRERASLGLLMSYYHEGRKEIGQAWRNVEVTADQYNLCATQWSSTHPEATEEELRPAPCQKERDAAQEAIELLNQLLESARTYMWEGWGVVRKRVPSLLPAANPPQRK